MSKELNEFGRDYPALSNTITWARYQRLLKILTELTGLDRAEALFRIKDSCRRDRDFYKTLIADYRLHPSDELYKRLRKLGFTIQTPEEVREMQERKPNGKEFFGKL